MDKECGAQTRTNGYLYGAVVREGVGERVGGFKERGGSWGRI